MKYIELFAGIGGFRRASEMLSRDFSVPLKCVAFSEIDPMPLKHIKPIMISLRKQR